MNSAQVTHDESLGVLLELRGRVALMRVHSKVLENNPLGDGATRTQAVYIPPQYDAAAGRRFPVLYYLPGYGGNVASNLAFKPWEPNLFQRCDALIARGDMPPALVVVVDGWTRLGGSQFVDSAHNGAYATYITREVIAATDASFRTEAHARGRGVFGHSSGGFGALHLAMRHPGVFGAVASHSGDAYFRYAYLPSFEKTRRELVRSADLQSFAAEFAAREARSGDQFEAMMTLAYAAAYTPKSANAFAIDLPFSLTTGEIDEAVFARWLRFDPVEEVCEPASIAALTNLRLCYLDCGRRDEWSLDVGARIFSERAAARGIPVQYEEFDGKHGGVKHRFERSMPLMLAALAKTSLIS